MASPEINPSEMPGNPSQSAPSPDQQTTQEQVEHITGPEAPEPAAGGGGAIGLDEAEVEETGE